MQISLSHFPHAVAAVEIACWGIPRELSLRSTRDSDNALTLVRVATRSVMYLPENGSTDKRGRPPFAAQQRGSLLSVAALKIYIMSVLAQYRLRAMKASTMISRRLKMLVL